MLANRNRKREGIADNMIDIAHHAQDIGLEQIERLAHGFIAGGRLDHGLNGRGKRKRRLDALCRAKQAFGEPLH